MPLATASSIDQAEGQTSKQTGVLPLAPRDSALPDRALWSDSVQSLLAQPPASLPQVMIVGGLLFTAVVGAWSWFGTIEEVRAAQGRLAPQGDVYRVQPAMAGEVTEILVKEGDVVNQGQTIARLDHRLLEKEIERLTHSLNAYRQQLAQTKALMQQTQLQLDTLQAIARADVAARQSSIGQEETVVETNQRLLDQLQLDRQAQTERMARLQVLVERGAFAEDHLFQVEQALRDRDRSITEIQGSTERSTSTMAQLEAELAQSQAMAEKSELEANQQLQQLRMEATQLEASINETQTLLQRSQTELAQTLLLAPVEGVVSTLVIANVGEVLQPGQTVAEVAPSTAPLVLASLLPSHQAGLVEVGMPVNLKFDAFPYQDYGVMTGHVLSISPDAQVDETLGAVYRVDIALDNTHIAHEGDAIALRAGQTATAEIVVRQRRIISLVLDPIRKLQKGNLSL
jgi:hemolysin D